MKTAWVVIALSAAAWGCDARAASTAPVQDPKDGPSYEATVKIDDV
jgi:hypothetical protein